MNRFWRAAAAVSATAGACLMIAPTAFAHEQRQVGTYQFTVGWEHEPTYVGEENAIQLFLHDAHGNPIDDLGSPPTLQVAVIFGGETSSPLDLEASFDPDTGFGTRGEFDAAIVPTAAGNYTFHFFGSINGRKVDERFSSSPSTFNPVDDPTAIQFPTKVPTVPALATLANRLSSRLDHATTAVGAARHQADSGHNLALTGVILGAVGLGLGALALGVVLRRTGSGRPSTADSSRSGG